MRYRFSLERANRAFYSTLLSPSSKLKGDILHGLASEIDCSCNSCEYDKKSGHYTLVLLILQYSFCITYNILVSDSAPENFQPKPDVLT